MISYWIETLTFITYCITMTKVVGGSRQHKWVIISASSDDSVNCVMDSTYRAYAVRVNPSALTMHRQIHTARGAGTPRPPVNWSITASTAIINVCVQSDRHQSGEHSDRSRQQHGRLGSTLTVTMLTATSTLRMTSGCCCCKWRYVVTVAHPHTSPHKSFPP